MNEEAAALPAFQWAAPEVGTRHQLGGAPSFLQPAEVPNCSKCRSPMTFYGQLDSVNDEVILGDCGLVYVFVCFDCPTADAFVQSG